MNDAAKSTILGWVRNLSPIQVSDTNGIILYSDLGSRTEQLLMVFCKQTKLRYTKLTEEENNG